MHKKKNIIPLFYLVAFIEGGSLMACELLGAKFIAPFFGTSLYVWTSVIGTTLLGLAVGYYFGGFVSEKSPKYRTLLVIILAAAFFMGIMPYLSKGVMNVTLPLELRLGVSLSCFVFLLPPFIAFGMVSPIIIRLVTKDVKDTGKWSGRIYAISTIGGICAIFIYAFLFIPYLGLVLSAFITAAMLAISAVVIIWVSLTAKAFENTRGTTGH